MGTACYVSGHWLAAVTLTLMSRWIVVRYEGCWRSFEGLVVVRGWWSLERLVVVRDAGSWAAVNAPAGRHLIVGVLRRWWSRTLQRVVRDMLVVIVYS